MIFLLQFDAVEEMKNMRAAREYKKGVMKLKEDLFAQNSDGTGRNPIAIAIDEAMSESAVPHQDARESQHWRENYRRASTFAKTIDSSFTFNGLVNCCIAISGCTMGLSTDNIGDKNILWAVDFLCLLVFTFEMAIRILSLKFEPMQYFHSYWNCFDALIVVNGWLDIADLAFEGVTILRLLRLLRVFRLARSLPRLRAIVESLIQGFASVFWILLLMILFNYITGVGGGHSVQR